jgi:carbon monoxide dehydrogenase subunit G
MIEVRFGGIVPVPREEVFDYVTDPSHLPEYVPGVESVAILEGTDGPPLRWQVSLKLLGQHRRFECERTEIDRPRMTRFIVREGGELSSEHERMFIEVPEGTRLEFVSRQRPRPGLSGQLDRTLIRWLVQRMFDRSIVALTARLTEGRRGGESRPSG